MIRSAALAFALLALLLAAPAWFPEADAQTGPTVEDLEERIESLEEANADALAVVGALVARSLPPSVEVPIGGLVPYEAFSGPSAFGLECRAAAAVSESQVAQDRLGGGGRWVCVRPAYPPAP